MRRIMIIALGVALIGLAPERPESAVRQQAPESRAWIEESNRHAKVLLDVLARFAPEGAGRLGVGGLDEEVTRLTAEGLREQRETLKVALATLQEAAKREQHPLIRQDLEILLRSARNSVRALELGESRLLPYVDVTALVFGGLRSLLDAQVPPERRKAALVRLAKYAGTAQGYEPIAGQAAARTKARLADAALLAPARSQLERELGNGPILRGGIAKLFEQYGLEGWRETFKTLDAQLAAYEQFIKSDVLPKARTDFRLPRDLYTLSLEQTGVDIAPDALAGMARKAFAEIQKEMQQLAPAVAKARGFAATDYREVIRALKKEQLVGEAILPHYRKRLEQIEAIIRRENLVTLPQREARIRIATDAEAAQSPAPNMRPPRLLGNTGEAGEFVLPLNIPAAPGAAATQTFDDFTFEAASWSLTAHEARPGHEMQFAKIIEAGVSVPRAVFAFNSTNVEGWGLYSEWMMQPFMPPDGQLISLQFRLMRAARAFLDPELHLGKTSPDDARRVLRDDVVLSGAMTEQEVERYMFRAPAQATSYFYGYTQLRSLRPEIEKAMGSRFNARAFHDFILAQGLVPPDMLRKAATEHFAR